MSEVYGRLRRRMGRKSRRRPMRGRQVVREESSGEGQRRAETPKGPQGPQATEGAQSAQQRVQQPPTARGGPLLSAHGHGHDLLQGHAPWHVPCSSLVLHTVQIRFQFCGFLLLLFSSMMHFSLMFRFNAIAWLFCVQFQSHRVYAAR